MRVVIMSALGGLLIGSALSVPQPASADRLLIEHVRQSRDMNLPSRGLTQAEVESRYGQPLQRRGPVGEPPISRWVYNDFTVYFEDRFVLRAVAKSETASTQPQAGEGDAGGG